MHGFGVAMAENEEPIVVPDSYYSLWHRANDISVLLEVNVVPTDLLAACRCTFGSRGCM